MLFASWASACLPPHRQASGPAAHDDVGTNDDTGSPSGSQSGASSAGSKQPAAFDRPRIGLDFRTVLRRLDGPLRSRGHAGGRWLATQYGNEDGARSYDGGVALQGSLLLSEHAAPSDPGPILVMQKQPSGYDPERGDWYYAFLTSDLRVLREGKLADCSTCHGMAQHDHVFGPAPRAPAAP